MFLSIIVNAQDPNYSQFFSSPLTISPAFVGYSDCKWRGAATFRNQSLGIGNSYNTKTLSFDGRIYNNEVSQNYLGLGGYCMLDDAMSGIYQSNYFSLNTAYHITLDKGEGFHALTVGLGWIYNKVNIDFSSLTTSQQLYSLGFNRTLPTGEPSLKDIPSYSSVSSGLMYSFTAEDMIFDIGVAGYRFIKTKQTVFDNGMQFTTPRYDAHINYGKVLNNHLNIFLNGYYQTQNGFSGFIGGGYISYILLAGDEAEKAVNLGGYYRLNDSFIPYMGFIFNDIQVGLSYDIKASQTTGSITTNSFEVSLIYRNHKNSKNPLFW